MSQQVDSDGTDTDKLIITEDSVKIQIDEEIKACISLSRIITKLKDLDEEENEFIIDDCSFCLIWKESLSRWDVNIYFQNGKRKPRYWQFACKRMFKKSNNT